MTTVDELPFGAEAPDELLVAYANGSLSPGQRAEVDRWLAVHPEWNSRLNAYRAIGGAVRQAAASSDGPSIGSLTGLWAAIDAQPQARPLLPPPPPPPAHRGAGGRRSTNWLLAVAAALIVAVAAASVVVATTGNDDGTIASRPARSVTTEASDGDTGLPPAGNNEPAPTGTGDVDAAATLRAAAKDTAEQDTAHTAVHLIGVSDVSGTQLADIFEDEVTATIEGTGQVEFPERAVFDTTYTLAEAPDLPAQHSVTVQDGDQTEVSCNGGPFVPPAEADGCTEFGFGSSFTGPLAAVELLASAQSGVRVVGAETLEGVETQRFRLVATLPDETGELRDITTDVWIGADDGLIHQVVQTGDIVIIVPANEALPEDLLVPTTITLTYTLGQFGEPVDIPAIG